MDFIEITILNWEKYNPRKDFKSPRWFALSNRFFEDAEFFEFTDAERLVWLYLLCQASMKNQATIQVFYQHAHHVARLPKKVVTSAIEKLKIIKCIAVPRTRSVRGTYESVRDPNATVQNNTIQDSTEQNIAQPYGFAVFWSGYPRKVGRSKAESKYNAALRAGHSPEDLIKARDNYLAHLKQNQTEAKYIKHGSTFMSEWKDWLDPSAGESKSFGEKKKTTLEVLKEALGGS